MTWPKLAFVALFGLYFGPASLWAEPGFQPAASPQVPEVLRLAAAKVLQIWIPIGFQRESQARYAAILRALDKIQANDLRAEITYRFMRADVSLCQARALPNCRVTNRVTQGSAFALEDGTLIGSRHYFSQGALGLPARFAGLAEDWVTDLNSPSERPRVEADIAEFKRNPLKHAMFMLTDAQGKVVFESARQGFRFLRYSFLTDIRGKVDLEAGQVGIEGVEPRFESPVYGGAGWLESDSVRIQLTARLPGFRAAPAESCRPGANLAILGFAGVTTKTRAAVGARDSVYNELEVARGKALSLDEIAMRAQRWDSYQAWVKDVHGHGFLVTDADATSGLSGGPIVNMRGEVCGLLKAVFPKDEKFVMSEKFQVLEAFSLGIPLEYLTGI